MVPIGGVAVAEETHPLELLRCPRCTLVQLSTIVDPDEVFPPDYPYSSGNSRGLHENFEDLARQAERLAGLGPDDLVVDIGANDGTLLSKFECRTVGVEPTRQARKIAGPAYQAPFTEKLARHILDEHGPAKVVTACNVLAHVEDLDSVMRGIKALLAPDGLLIAENHDLESVLAGQWDTVYHEHLRFYSPYTFHLLLRKHEMTAIRWQDVPTHGGSFRMIAELGCNGYKVPPLRHYDFRALTEQAARSRYMIRDAAGDGIVGIGATARATTIINYVGLDAPRLEYVCEVPGSDKIGHYIPGTTVPVVDEQRLFDEQPERALLFSWHLADSIVPKLRDRGYRGEIIVPLPEVRSL
jgi:SAM-dependent methyltransferase